MKELNILAFSIMGRRKTNLIQEYLGKDSKDIPIFFDEQNESDPAIFNTLYEICYGVKTEVSHMKPYKTKPYKYGKHTKGVK